MTVRIFVSIQNIGPAIIVMIFSNFAIQFYEKMRLKTSIFYMIILDITINSFWKGITHRHWNSSLNQILGEYVT